MIDALLRNWLQNAARQKLYQAASQAAHKHASGSPQPQASQPEVRTRPCDVGLVFAQGSEAGGLEDRLAGSLITQAAGFRFLQGGLSGRHVVTVHSGTGGQAATKATQLLIAGHTPGWIISAGFAAGLQATLKAGDLVMADEIADTSGNRLSLDLKVPPEALAAMPQVHVGRILTVQRPVRKVAEKQALGQQHGALACDMQSLAVAEVCRADKVRCLAIRIIISTFDEELPRDVDRVLHNRSTAARLGAALGALVNRPGSAKDYLKQKESALVCSQRLALFLEGVIQQLAPQAAL